MAFLLTVRPQVPIGYQYKFTEDFISQVGLVYVRGCEIEGMLDDTGKVIEEGKSSCFMHCAVLLFSLESKNNNERIYKGHFPTCR